MTMEDPTFVIELGDGCRSVYLAMLGHVQRGWCIDITTEAFDTTHTASYELVDLENDGLLVRDWDGTAGAGIGTPWLIPHECITKVGFH